MKKRAKFTKGVMLGFTRDRLTRASDQAYDPDNGYRAFMLGVICQAHADLYGHQLTEELPETESRKNTFRRRTNNRISAYEYFKSPAFEYDAHLCGLEPAFVRECINLCTDEINLKQGKIYV